MGDKIVHIHLFGRFSPDLPTHRHLLSRKEKMKTLSHSALPQGGYYPALPFNYEVKKVYQKIQCSSHEGRISGEYATFPLTKYIYDESESRTFSGPAVLEV